MTEWIKQGVLGELNVQMRKCHGRLVRYYKDNGRDFYVTSRREGNHSAGSLHPDGGAEDFSGQGVPVEEIKIVCGKDFDVVDEGTHIHYEYDPK